MVDEENELTDQILLGSETPKKPSYVTITETELKIEKQHEPFCWQTRSRLEGGEEVTFITKNDGILF